MKTVLLVESLKRRANLLALKRCSNYVKLEILLLENPSEQINLITLWQYAMKMIMSVINN